MLAFLTAYGRCVADQLGILHTSGTSCCMVVCEKNQSSCQQCPDEHPADPSQAPVSEDNQDPKPCQLCIIIDTDGVVSSGEVKIPIPNLHDYRDNPDYSLLIATLAGIDPAAAAPLELRPSADPPGIARAHLQRILCRVTPIRGPSMA